MKNSLILFFSIFLFGCTSRVALNNQAENESELGVRLIVAEKYKQGGSVVFIIENNSDTVRYINPPSRLSIQRKIDTLWYDLRIRHCPCGAPCAPPAYVPIQAYQQIDVSWNQKESWCKGSNSPGNDKSEYVRRGSYRFVVHVNDSPEREQSDDEIIYAEFKIL